ncbi:DUF3795 domain-containing protein [bacterium]|nr:DUF3795 domain-containing protein [bacterium]
MAENIAYCGLLCSRCTIYLAAREADASKKEKLIQRIIEVCREHYGIEYQVSDITECDGCTAEGGSLFKACAGCEIRKCAIGKGIENCACCTEYACKNLENLFKTDTGAKMRLEAVRSRIM